MLDKNGLENLLDAFHPDREQASLAYQALRQRLVRFFEWNHADLPEGLADETLDRLARRLTLKQGEIRDPVRYGVGIARLVLQEYWRGKSRMEEALSAMAQRNQDAARIEQERIDWEERAGLLEECWESIPEPSRELIRRYYSIESRTQAQQRQKMAEGYGISTNALRNRAMRIRTELEKQVLLLQTGERSSAGKINRQK